MTMQSDYGSPSFSEKYALKYYSFVTLHAFLIMSYELTHTPHVGSFLFNLVAILTIFTSDSGQITNPKYHNKHIYHLFPLYASCFMSVLSICYLWYRFQWVINCPISQLPINMLYIAFTIGGTIDACHQLLHRNQLISRITSVVTLIIYQFTTYPIEHLYVHHKKVGSEQDPITSPKNKSLYRYYIQAIFSSYVANYRYSKKIFFGCILMNLTYVAILAYAAYLEQLTFQEGCRKVFFFVLLSYFCLFALETVQYIEHYGLIYRKTESQNKVQQICAWNTDTNAFLNCCIFRFQRHSDHHMNAYKLYSTMQLNEKMPQFPANFVAMGYISYFPFLWYSCMNPLVDRVLKRQKISSSEINYVKKVAITVSLLFLALSTSKVIPLIL